MTRDFTENPRLLALRDLLEQREEERLSPLATLSKNGIRRVLEMLPGHRQTFAVDADRILHSRAYTRYIDKTQVFSMVVNDHITHRVLHVQLVSKIARSIGRFMDLNEDLIEAIALGHDIGHPPFGHDGETILAALCVEQGLQPFQHNIQSVQFLDRLEKRGRGWNLTLQTLDGILCHDGEVHNRSLSPDRKHLDFATFDEKLRTKANNPAAELMPMTLEGCVVRFADTIAYIGRDIEDAITLKLIARSEIPERCRTVLGDTNGTIVYQLVADLILNGSSDDAIAFSTDIAEALKELKAFNYQRIYRNPLIKKDYETISNCYRALFETYLEDLDRHRGQSPIFTDFLADKPSVYAETHGSAAVARDFIAGMTDNYFLNKAADLGCEIPAKVRI
ncbi:MAG: HD domain-containing protein [Desulfobulbaceae bacterium]|nr:HD domain-containing protein [Desulfobulbaceae bacterium]